MWGFEWYGSSNFEWDESTVKTWDHPKVKMTEERFDLLKHEKMIKDSYTPRGLYYVWEEILTLYDRGVIGAYELDNLRDLFTPKMEQLVALERQLGGQ